MSHVSLYIFYFINCTKKWCNFLDIIPLFIHLQYKIMDSKLIAKKDTFIENFENIYIYIFK